MLDPGSPVARVGLEQARFPWFDDIVTFYRPDTRSARHAIDAHQIKFHVVADGALSFEALMDPAFIGSKNKSLLQRIVEAYRARGSNTAVVLMSPWGIAYDDLLGKMTQTGIDGSLRLHLLFDGKEHSLAAEIRSKLRAHARAEDLELRETLDHFRVEQTPSLRRLQSMLDDKLARHRFKTVGEEALPNIYDDLGRKLISLPSREFDADGLRTLLRDEGLVDDGNTWLEPKRVGIRSFVRQAEYLDEFTTMLDLLDMFDHRHLRPGATWCKMSDRVRIFMAAVDDERNDAIEMHLSCHNSIAYAAGNAVSAKSGTRYIVHQTGQRGASAWDLSERENGSADALWVVHEIRLREDAREVAVAVSLTHSIGRDVEQYVGKCIPSIGTLLIFEPVGGSSQSSVRSGAHAAALAETFDHILATQRCPDQRMAMLHLFAAAPNGFTFALGRAARRVGQVTLYEYDFERKDPQGYSPSIILNTP